MAGAVQVTAWKASRQQQTFHDTAELQGCCMPLARTIPDHIRRCSWLELGQPVPLSWSFLRNFLPVSHIPSVEPVQVAASAVPAIDSRESWPPPRPWPGWHWGNQNSASIALSSQMAGCAIAACWLPCLSTTQTARLGATLLQHYPMQRREVSNSHCIELTSLTNKSGKIQVHGLLYRGRTCCSATSHWLAR